jgi:hypothetical membrane protein
LYPNFGYVYFAFFSAPGYSIAKHTTSQLAAQQTPNSWIMNLTFILMGLSSIHAGWNHYRKFWLHRVLLLIFGISLCFTAIYSHAPITTNLGFDIQEDSLHSIFASSAGFSFTMLAIATGLIKKQKSEMVLPIAIGIAATILSLMIFQIENLMGVWQRILFIMSFGWLIYEFYHLRSTASQKRGIEVIN